MTGKDNPRPLASGTGAEMVSFSGATVSTIPCGAYWQQARRGAGEAAMKPAKATPGMMAARPRRTGGHRVRIATPDSPDIDFNHNQPARSGRENDHA